MLNSIDSFLEISKALNSILDLNRLLEVILDSAIRSVGVERGIIFLKSDDGSLEPCIVRNVDKETVANAEEISRSITTEVAESGKYFLSSNVQSDPKAMMRTSVKEFKILSIICIPLICDRNVIGTLYLDNRKATKIFVDDDIHFLQIFANLAAIAIVNAKQYEATKSEAKYWKEQASLRYGFESIIYASEKMKLVCQRALNVANTNVSILITGESGTGKELLARAIHLSSNRRDAKFIPVNCSALPEHILESELFGVKKGAFTGANCDRKGLLEEANNGTVFLDEIADMQPELQAKLLRFLQEGEIRRVGDTQFRYVNVRVLSATNRNIEEEIKENNFREDLYYRLCGIGISIPPLRERTEDILPLAHHFIQTFCKENNIPQKLLSKEAAGALLNYSYPGNVRELQNIVRKAVLLSEQIIGVKDLDLPEIKLLRDDVDDFDEATRNHIIKILDKVGWNQTRAAELLGLNRTTLQAKIKKLNIERNKQ